MRTGRGQYYIPDKPIYIGQLQEVYDTRYNAHLKRQNDRKTHKKDSINIEKAIKPARKGKMPVNGIAYETPSAQKLKITTGKILSEMLNWNRV